MLNIHFQIYSNVSRALEVSYFHMLRGIAIFDILGAIQNRFPGQKHLFEEQKDVQSMEDVVLGLLKACFWSFIDDWLVVHHLIYLSDCFFLLLLQWCSNLLLIKNIFSIKTCKSTKDWTWVALHLGFLSNRRNLSSQIHLLLYNLWNNFKTNTEIILHWIQSSFISMKLFEEINYTILYFFMKKNKRSFIVWTPNMHFDSLSMILGY